MTFKISMNSPCTNLFLRINWYFLGGNIFTQIFKISTELYPNNINYYKTTLLQMVEGIKETEPKIGPEFER